MQNSSSESRRPITSKLSNRRDDVLRKRKASVLHSSVQWHGASAMDATSSFQDQSNPTDWVDVPSEKKPQLERVFEEELICEDELLNWRSSSKSSATVFPVSDEKHASWTAPKYHPKAMIARLEEFIQKKSALRSINDSTKIWDGSLKNGTRQTACSSAENPAVMKSDHATWDLLSHQGLCLPKPAASTKKAVSYVTGDAQVGRPTGRGNYPKKEPKNDDHIVKIVRAAEDFLQLLSSLTGTSDDPAVAEGSVSQDSLQDSGFIDDDVSRAGFDASLEPNEDVSSEPRVFIRAKRVLKDANTAMSSAPASRRQTETDDGVCRSQTGKLRDFSLHWQPFHAENSLADCPRQTRPLLPQLHKYPAPLQAASEATVGLGENIFCPPSSAVSPSTVHQGLASGAVRRNQGITSGRSVHLGPPGRAYGFSSAGRSPDQPRQEHLHPAEAFPPKRMRREEVIRELEVLIARNRREKSVLQPLEMSMSEKLQYFFEKPVSDYAAEKLTFLSDPPVSESRLEIVFSDEPVVVSLLDDFLKHANPRHAAQHASFAWSTSLSSVYEYPLMKLHGGITKVATKRKLSTCSGEREMLKSDLKVQIENYESRKTTMEKAFEEECKTLSFFDETFSGKPSHFYVSGKEFHDVRRKRELLDTMYQEVYGLPFNIRP